MSKQLEWTTQQRTVNALIPYDKNPRKISEAKRMKMIESLQKFNLVDIPVIDTDETVISGHQRLKALQAIGRGDDVIDVRVPNRKLSDKELKEYSLLANTHFGEFDFDLLESDFDDINFDDLGIDISFDSIEDDLAVNSNKKTEEKELKYFKKTHVLISFPPEKIMELQELLEQLKSKEYLEYEQSSN